MVQSPVLCWKAIVEKAGGLTWRDRGLTGFSIAHLGIRSGASRYSCLHGPFVQVKVRRPSHKKGAIQKSGCGRWMFLVGGGVYCSASLFSYLAAV